MNPVLSTELQEVMEAVHFRPAVSIILPFEPKMNLKSELSHLLKTTVDRVERELTGNYPADTSMLVMQKLRRIIRELNLNTHKKSIAIYVSPVFEKILYLDIAVEERVMVDESFEIRDLVYAKKQLHKYLVLLLSYNESRMFLGNSSSFIKIVSNSGKTTHAYVNDAPERVANFSDMSERKEVQMEKFLRQIDNGLDIILNAYQLPLFVLGTKRIAGHFKKLTKHAASVIQYVHGNYEAATPEELKKVLEPYINDWRSVRNKDLLNQLEQAFGKTKLAVGIRNVWREAMNRKGRLLIVEKNYVYAALHGNREDMIYAAEEPYNKFSYIKDAIDQVIEKVLENGGDVEFVDKELLKDYDHIALIQYY